MKIQDILKKYGMFIILIALVIFFSIATNGVFLSSRNVINVFRQIAMLGIASVGLAVLMISGGLDLSIGSMQALSGVVCAMLMVNFGLPISVSIILTLIMGIIIGLFHGFVVNVLGLSPLITTLGTYTTIRGLAYVVTGGLPVYGFNESFRVIGQGYIWFIPVPVIIMVIVFMLGYILLNKTTYGRYIYGLGGNEEVSRLSGINTKKMKYALYSISSLLASIAGIVLLSRINSGQPKAGHGFEFDAITAVVLGGVSMSGGTGNIYGVLIGVLIMGILKNGMILTNVNEYYQMVIQGLILITAVALDIAMSKRRKLNKKEILRESANTQRSSN